MELPLGFHSRTTREKIGSAIKRSRNERFERELSFQIRAHGLPEPHEQYHFAAELGRKFRADFAWPAREYRILCEVQGGIFMRGGGGHSHPMHIVKDVERQQLAVLLGWYLVPVTTDQVKKGQAIALLERIFASRGWRR
jgi:very-short-patch-repair endonuclease